LRIVLPEQRVGDAVVDLGAELLGHAAYEAHRIGLGVPNGGLDFTYGDAFPHEADMDQLSGIDFDKGCYVGQEVVSRVEHRGIARARIVTIVADEKAPGAGLPVMAGERQIGTTGSASGRQGLALLRLDRLADAVQAGIPLTAGGIVIRAMRPQWARFSFPNDKISR
jgi:tRNA-modifying protein YgfZ